MGHLTYVLQAVIVLRQFVRADIINRRNLKESHFSRMKVSIFSNLSQRLIIFLLCWSKSLIYGSNTGGNKSIQKT